VEVILKWVLSKLNGEIGLALSGIEQGQVMGSCERGYGLYDIKTVNYTINHK
jgi:hypothetical protein